MAHKGHNGLIGVVGIDPLKAVRSVGALKECGLFEIKRVEGFDELLLVAVGLVFMC